MLGGQNSHRPVPGIEFDSVERHVPQPARDDQPVGQFRDDVLTEQRNPSATSTRIPITGLPQSRFGRTPRRGPNHDVRHIAEVESLPCNDCERRGVGQLRSGEVLGGLIHVEADATDESPPLFDQDSANFLPTNEQVVRPLIRGFAVR